MLRETWSDSFMRLTIFFAATLALAAAAPLTHAQNKGVHYRYRWTDTHGIVQYADSPTAEALQAGYDVIDARGSVVRHVDRMKTAAEKRSDADAAVAATQAQQQETRLVDSDRQLLAAYPTEQALIEMQNKRIAAIDQQLGNIKISQTDQEKSLTDQLAFASTFERENKPVPAPVKQQIDTLRANVEAQQKAAATKQADLTAAKQKAEAELAHYRELRAAQAKANGE
jgi:hypothetical protein